MAPRVQLPCDGDDICMICKAKPQSEEMLTCSTCVTPWHATCLAAPPPTLASTLQWCCPDCSCDAGDPVPAIASTGPSGKLVVAIRAIEDDASLTEKEKARKRQELVSGRVEEDENDKEIDKGKRIGNEILDEVEKSFSCGFCMQLPERPVTTPCGHNFCLKCFQKWIGQGKRSCAKCRQPIPEKVASQPRINLSIVGYIRTAKTAKNVLDVPKIVTHFEQNKDKPDQAYTTERAKKPGLANAASGRILVTVPSDHFGPITAENDPENNQGLLVGDSWPDRLACRQYGAHLPHVAGIAGQSDYGAQSVALSGGYEDDEDHGEWFLYTGSGGRDLSGNKRTNKDQSFDQKFEKSNEALRVSCKKGYPVRVVRSHKEKRSAYAPETGVRYDGVYRIEKCWRKPGIQGFKVCRYLFVRCDNDPAPWTSDDRGDRPRRLPPVPELKKATDITERKESPSWGFDEADGRWKWIKPPPMSRKSVNMANPGDRKRARKALRESQSTTLREKLLKEFSCQICRQVMNLPLTTPCAHNFCKSCLEGRFAGQAFVTERSRGGRTLRTQKNIFNCPLCPTDISDFLQNPQVNRELMNVIESLKKKCEEAVEETNQDSDVQEGNDNYAEDSLESETQLDPEKPLKRSKLDDGDCSQDADSLDKSEDSIKAVSSKKENSTERKGAQTRAKTAASGNVVEGSAERKGAQTRARTAASGNVAEGSGSRASSLGQSSDEDFD